MDELRLIAPSMAYEQQILALKQEILEAQDTDAFAGCSMLESYDSVADWLEHLEIFKSAETCPPNRVPSDLYLAVRVSDDRVVGIIDLRHHIDHPILALWAGHIGYTIRPAERRKGYGKQMLKLNLENCRKLKIDNVMITCHRGNVASEKVILANGGVFEKEIEVDGSFIKRYWITIS